MYNKPNKQSGAYQVGVQVSHRVLSEVQKEDHLQLVQSRLARYNKDTLQAQGSGDHRRPYDAGSRASVSKHTTENERVKLHGVLEGKSALMMFDKHANLKYKFGKRHFWAEGYYVSTVGPNEAAIKKYIHEQEKHDIALGKLSVHEYEDPFKGGK